MAVSGVMFLDFKILTTFSHLSAVVFNTFKVSFGLSCGLWRGGT